MHPSTPKYVQLIETLKADIQSGSLIAGQQLPNEDEIAEQYGMSRGTVRKAIAELQRMGLVRKEQGRGTFVNGAKATLNGFSLVEFDAYARAKDQIPSTETLVFEIVEADEVQADQLAITSGDELIHIVQLRLASGVVMVYEERYFSRSLCPDLSRDLLEQYSLHYLLVERYQIPLVKLSHTIEMDQLLDEQFDLFRVSETVSIFRVERLSYTRHEDAVVPAVLYQALYRADNYQFQAQFHSSI